MKRTGLRALQEMGDPPVAARRHWRDSGIAIEAKEGHGGRKHARSFILALVQQFPGGGGDDGMDLRMLLRPQMVGGHHEMERCRKAPAGIGKKGDRKSTRLNSSH